MWIEFPQGLTQVQGSRHYVTLFESAFATASLGDHKNLALSTSYLRAIPPPPPEATPLDGLTRVNLHEANLTQWVSYIQDVALGMRKPPQAAIDCPTEDIMGILHKLERMTNITFCWFCFILGGYCRCHPEVPQAPTPLWNPPGYIYATMAAVTTTSASTSMVGVPTVADPPPGYPALPLSMDTTSPPKAPNVLAGAGVGRGKAMQTMLATVRPQGPRQVRPQSAIQQQGASAGQEATQATPYKQQVLLPQVPRPAAGTRLCTAAVITRASTITSTASGIEAGARGRSRERSSPRGSRDQSTHGRRPRFSTRGSRKQRPGIVSQNPMDDLDNYVPSGWKMDLLHIVGCHYAHQIGPLTNEKWKKGSKAFLQAMKLRREKEWLAIKELEPLNYMSYVAAMFKQVTSHYLKGLSGYTGWMRASGYYHWKVDELNQLDCCPHLRGIPVPKGPIPQPSTGQQSPKPQQAQQLCRSDKPEVQTSASGGHRGEQLPALMELDDLPQAEARAGDPSSWYNRSVQEEEWREVNKKLVAEVKSLQEALGRSSSSTVAVGSARPKELKAVYKHIATCEPPRGNIASTAIQAFYPTLHHGQWRTLSSQALAMISEYHTACVINGSSTTSPIPSQEILLWWIIPIQLEQV